MNQAIELQGLSKRYGTFLALSGLDLSAPRGSAFALLGPNGAGKTTLIRMLCGILRPSDGQARVLGLDPFSGREKLMLKTGCMPDDPFFQDYQSGRELIRFAANLRGLDPEAAQSRGLELAERLGLARADLEAYASDYSRGMKKKLAAVIAWQHDPELLLLDEPTYGLDPAATREIHRLFAETIERGATIFFSTHLLDQAERAATHCAVLLRGSLAASAPIAELRREFAAGGTLEEAFFALTEGAKAQVDANEF